MAGGFEEYSVDGLALTGLSRISQAQVVSALASIQEARQRSEKSNENEIIWAHWDLDSTDHSQGPVDADPIKRFLRDLELLPRPPSGKPSIAERGLVNLIMDIGSGPYTLSLATEHDPSTCFFGCDLFDVRYAFPNEITAGELRGDNWRRQVVFRTHLGVLAGEAFVVSVRSQEADYLERTFVERDGIPINEYIDSFEWRWSAAGIRDIVKERLSPVNGRQIMSGDVLAHIAAEAVDSFDEIRAWLTAELEKLETLRLGAGVTRYRDSVAIVGLERRYGWLASQATRARVALDWNHDELAVPETLFSDRDDLRAMRKRRLRLLANLSEFRGELRASIELLTTAVVLEHLDLGRQDAARTAGLQRTITFVSATLLAPGLVAATFGALPSVLAHDPGARAALLIGLMIACGLSLWMGLRVVERRGRRASKDKPR